MQARCKVSLRIAPFKKITARSFCSSRRGFIRDVINEETFLIDGVKDLRAGAFLSFGKNGGMVTQKTSNPGSAVVSLFQKIEKPVDIIGTEIELQPEWSVPSSLRLFGNLLNSVGQSIDNKDLSSEEQIPLDLTSPSNLDPSTIAPFWTGTRIIDYQARMYLGRMTPFAFIGPRNTQKTSVALDAILLNAKQNREKKNEKDKFYSVICVPDMKGLKRVQKFLDEHGLSQDALVIANEDNATSLARVLAPFTAATICDHLCYHGFNTIFLTDEIQQHFEAYKQLQNSLRSHIGTAQLYQDIFERFTGKSCASIVTLDTLDGAQRAPYSSYPLPTDLEAVMRKITGDSVFYFSPELIYSPPVEWTTPPAKLDLFCPVWMQPSYFHLRSQIPFWKQHRMGYYSHSPDMTEEEKTDYTSHHAKLNLLFNQPLHAPSSAEQNYVKLTAYLEGTCDLVSFDQTEEALQFISDQVMMKLPSISQQSHEAIVKAVEAAEAIMLKKRSFR